MTRLPPGWLGGAIAAGGRHAPACALAPFMALAVALALLPAFGLAPPRAAAAGAPPAARSLRIATWNLNWLTLRPAGDPALPDDVRPRREGDFRRLAAFARALEADVVAFEEVDGPAAAAAVFPPADWQIVMAGGSAVQRVGLAVRHGIGITDQRDLTALEAPGPDGRALRRGLDMTLRLPGPASRPALSLRLLTLHLKSGCAAGRLPRAAPAARQAGGACATLARQIPLVTSWIAARGQEGVAFLVLGDFNRVLRPRDPMRLALEGAADLRILTADLASPCWGGESFIDHIVAGGPARFWPAGPPSVLVYRERAWRERARLSDHCPVLVTLNPR